MKEKKHISLIKNTLSDFILKIAKIFPFLKIIIPIFLICMLGSLLFLQIRTIQKLKISVLDITRKHEEIQKKLNDLENQDQYKRNEKLQELITQIQNTYSESVSVYEELITLKPSIKNASELDTLFASALSDLSKQEYASAQASLSLLKNKINENKVKLANEFSIPESVETKNTPPASGYQRQQVSTDVGNFMVDIISADLNSTRVIVDTASGSDCTNDCPTLPLSSYIQRNGAFAGVNGSYFCPAEYPSCAGKTNTFDTLLMNKDKVYFNSANNVYSTVPAVIFGGNWARFVGQSLEWGRDAGVDAVIANHPLLVYGGSVVFGGDDDPKKGSKGNRSFVGSAGNTVFIGVVHNATVAESARALKSLGLENALNLDNGGSTALWYNGSYKAGPGRNLPNVLLFVGK